MELGSQRSSENVEDRRGMGAIVIAIIYALLGGDPSDIINSAQQAPPPPEQRAPQKSGPPDEMQVFVSKVLGSTEDVWRQIFREANREYHDPRLVLYSGA